MHAVVRAFRPVEIKVISRLQTDVIISDTGILDSQHSAVKEISDGGRDYEVTVEFDTLGTRKMFASFAKLKKLEKS